MLNLWQNDSDVTAAPAPNEGHDLPATFGEGFDAAWQEGRMFAQSLAGDNARNAALDDYISEIEQKTGAKIQVGQGIQAEGISVSRLDEVNEAAAKLGLPELSQDELEQRAIEKSRAAETAYAAFGQREQTFGSRVGSFLGGAAASAADPINLLALPVAPEMEGVSVLGAALRWGAVAGVSQAAIEAAGAPFHEEVQPGYLESGAPILNVLGAAGMGAGLGGSTRFLGNLWSRVKTGAWPQSVRDAGNVVESEANIANTNVYPGPQGEAAHRQALGSAIDSLLTGRPIDVSDIITPELEAQSRSLMMRLEGERAFSLPIFDERAVRLLSEEAQLREQDTALTGQIGALPEGDLSAADRLNRLQAVEQQIASAPDAAERSGLMQRRDQILVDTTPEALQRGATPIVERQALSARRGAIANRLEEIQAERNQIEAENLGRAPAMLGQTTPIRGMPEPPAPEVRAVPVMQTRALAARLADEAKAAGRETGQVQPSLPFEATGAVARMREANEVLAGGVQQIARRFGYEMPEDEAARVAEKLVAASPEQADDILRDLQMSPRQVAEAPLRETAIPQIAPQPRIGEPETSLREESLATPEMASVVRADIDRERVAALDRGEAGFSIPVDVDKDGNAVMRSVDGAMNEVDAYHAAAEQIQACATGTETEAA